MLKILAEDALTQAAKLLADTLGQRFPGDDARCRRCAWICSTLCPDSTISSNAEGYPEIDYAHCKGCLICLANCPHHAIRAVLEHEVAGE